MNDSRIFFNSGVLNATFCLSNRLKPSSPAFFSERLLDEIALITETVRSSGVWFVDERTRDPRPGDPALLPTVVRLRFTTRAAVLVLPGLPPRDSGTRGFGMAPEAGRLFLPGEPVLEPGCVLVGLPTALLPGEFALDPFLDGILDSATFPRIKFCCAVVSFRSMSAASFGK